METNTGCGYKNGPLPSCAPLALAYVPAQQSSQPAYDAEKTLMRGTLFPGLDLPFMNVVNTLNVTGDELGQLQALRFVCDELRLYLDTHRDDTEAFEALKSAMKLAREAHRRYLEKHGPVAFADVEFEDSYNWVDGPWPWNSEA